MAIVQISRITHRKGLSEDLPQPLAGGELGWAVDQRKLYIGNGELADGAPVVGNTEILTEFSDLLGFATAYTYQGESAGYVAQTGASSGTPITQSLQERLDNFVVVTAFGATGDGVTDDTDAINRALFQLYCRQNNSQVRRSLYFPAGTYKVSDTLLIPPYARLHGDGADSSIIQFVVETWAANTSYAEGILVVNSGSHYRSIAIVPATGIDITNTSYWQPVADGDLPPYVIRSADSLQQTGINIGAGGAVTPQQVSISDMAITTDFAGNGSSISHDICLIEKAENYAFYSVGFAGSLGTSELVASTEDQAAVRFSGTASLPCKQIVFNDCQFNGVTYGINTDQLIQGVTVSNSLFDTLYRGIVLGDSTPVNGGPRGVRVMHNTFDNIYKEGVVIDTASLNATGYNTFYDVGNHFGGVASPVTPIITINADDNVSIGDLFQRTAAQAGTSYPRIQLWNSSSSVVPASIAATGSSQLQIGSYVRGQAGASAVYEIVDGLIDEPLFTANTAVTLQNGGFASFKLDYTIRRETAGSIAVRTGTLTVVAGGDDSAGEGIVYTDDYTENENTDVWLAATELSDVVTVSYTAGGTGYDGKIYLSLTHLA